MEVNLGIPKYISDSQNMVTVRNSISISEKFYFKRAKHSICGICYG